MHTLTFKALASSLAFFFSSAIKSTGRPISVKTITLLFSSISFTKKSVNLLFKEFKIIEQTC